MTKNIQFPKCFSEAKNKLRKKFRNMDVATIDDSIQHARIEYWSRGIENKIPDENQAFGWFLHAAHCYLYKEHIRLNHFCGLYDAANYSVPDFEDRFAYGDLWNYLQQGISERNISIVFSHAIGYSLQELAETEKMSLDAMKQRHARVCRAIRRKAIHQSYRLQ